jgi:hypothetical protein
MDYEHGLSLPLLTAARRQRLVCQITSRRASPDPARIREYQVASCIGSFTLRARSKNGRFLKSSSSRPARGLSGPAKTAQHIIVMDRDFHAIDAGPLGDIRGLRKGLGRFR